MPWHVLDALAWPAGSTCLWVTFLVIAAVQLDLVPFIGNAWFLAAVLGIVALSFVAELMGEMMVGLTLGS
jgi:hypothetical protein